MTVQEYVGSLLEIEVVAHVAHVQAVNGSFAEHEALRGLYEGASDQFDSFTEAYQGKYGIVRGYAPIKIQEGVDMISYLTNKAHEFEEYRNTLVDGYLQQMVDNTQELIYSTLFKLKNLG